MCAHNRSHEVCSSGPEKGFPNKAHATRAPLLLTPTDNVVLQDEWPGVEQSGTGAAGAPQNVHPGVGQTAAPTSSQPTSFPDGAAHKATDASRLADAPPTFQDNKMVVPQLPLHHPAAVVPFLCQMVHGCIARQFRNGSLYLMASCCDLHLSCKCVA